MRHTRENKTHVSIQHLEGDRRTGEGDSNYTNLIDVHSAGFIIRTIHQNFIEGQLKYVEYEGLGQYSVSGQDEIVVWKVVFVMSEGF